MMSMNRMPLAKRAQILGFLVEGMSLRAASRLADCSINTVTKMNTPTKTIKFLKKSDSTPS